MLAFQCSVGFLKKSRGGRYNDSLARWLLSGGLWKWCCEYLSSQFWVPLALFFLHYLTECTFSHFLPWFWIPHYTCFSVLFANPRTDLPVSQGGISFVSSDWPWRLMDFYSLKPLYHPMHMLFTVHFYSRVTKSLVYIELLVIITVY